jgi:fucose 4-O-acetylase-like acetyltransferase
MTLKQWKLFLISFLILLLSIYKLGDGIIFYAINRYNVSILLLFGGGVAGAFTILLLSKMIGEFSPLSFVGRYSLIVLLTHQMYLFLLRNLAYQMQLPQDSNLLSALLFVVVILLEIPTIFFCKKYMSWAFGLRELVK